MVRVRSMYRFVLPSLIGLGIPSSLPAQTSDRGMATPICGEFDTCNEKGWEAYQKGRFDEALQYFQAAILFERHPTVLYNMACAYFEIADFLKAGTFFREVFQWPPNQTPAADAKLRDGARRNFNKTLERLRDQGMYEYDRADFAKARFIFLDIITLEQQIPDLSVPQWQMNLLVANTYRNERQCRDAEPYYQKVLQVKDPGADLNKAREGIEACRQSQSGRSEVPVANGGVITPAIGSHPTDNTPPSVSPANTEKTDPPQRLRSGVIVGIGLTTASAIVAGVLLYQTDNTYDEFMIAETEDDYLELGATGAKLQNGARAATAVAAVSLAFTAYSALRVGPSSQSAQLPLPAESSSGRRERQRPVVQLAWSWNF